MRKYLPHAVIAAVLAMAGAQSIAADYTFRVHMKGVRANNSTPAPPVGGGGDTGTPPPGGYATSGVQFLRDGMVITELPFVPGEAVTLTLRNTSTQTLQGWLLNSLQGEAHADMTGTTCTQNTSSTVPVTLAPGAQCNFLLVPRMSEVRGEDSFVFRGIDMQPIPTALYLPSSGGSTLPPEM